MNANCLNAKELFVFSDMQLLESFFPFHFVFLYACNFPLLLTGVSDIVFCLFFSFFFFFADPQTRPIPNGISYSDVLKGSGADVRLLIEIFCLHISSSQD